MGDDSDTLQGLITSAHEAQLAGFGGVAYLPPGTLTITRQIDLPTFSSGGNAWDQLNPLVLKGCGTNITKIVCDSTFTAAYMLAHPSINTIINRDQNYGVEIEGITFEGPKDYAKPTIGIGIDNTRMASIHDCAFFGFPGGHAIHIYGHEAGGSFQTRIFGNTFGNNVYQNGGGYYWYDPAVSAEWSSRYCIWLDGPYPASISGRVNDTTIRDNRFVDFLVGAIRIQGHDTWTPSVGTNTGGSANTLSVGNVYYSPAGRKMEEGGTTPETGTLTGTLTNLVINLKASSTYGANALVGFTIWVQNAAVNPQVWEARTIASNTGGTPKAVTLSLALSFTPTTSSKYRILGLNAGGLSAAPSSTVVTLRTTNCLPTPATNLLDHYLAILDQDGIWQRRYITVFNTSTRQVTVSPAFGFTPVIGDNYRVGYADLAAQGQFADPTALQHAFYWASAYSARSIGDYFEETIWCAVHLSANEDFTLVNPEDTVNDSRYGIRTDGTAWHPRAVFAERPRGSDATPASIATSDVLLTDSTDMNAECGTLGRCKNDTGERVYVGDVVRISGASLYAIDSLSTSPYVHVVVASKSRDFFDDQDEMTWARSGIWKVKVAGTVAAGELLIPSNTTAAANVPVATATAAQLGASIGRTLQNGTANQKILTLIRGW